MDERICSANGGKAESGVIPVDVGTDDVPQAEAVRGHQTLNTLGRLVDEVIHVRNARGAVDNGVSDGDGSGIDSNDTSDSAGLSTEKVEGSSASRVIDVSSESDSRTEPVDDATAKEKGGEDLRVAHRVGSNSNEQTSGGSTRSLYDSQIRVGDGDRLSGLDANEGQESSSSARLRLEVNVGE